MGSVRVVYFQICSSVGGSPRQCQLRTASVRPCCNKNWLCIGTYMTYGGALKLSSLMVAKLDDNLPRLMHDRRDSVQATHRLPIKVFMWKMTLGRGRTWLNSLMVIVKGGHSCCLCGPRVSCWQVISLARWLLIRISMTPSDMGEACSLHSNIEVGMTLWLLWGFLDGTDFCISGMMLYHLLYELSLHAYHRLLSYLC
jgi:hypothetical protein